MWFKDHVYVATWISALVAVLALIWNISRGAARGQPIHWTRTMFMFLCLISFPIAVTPTFDTSAREFARYVFSFTIAAVLIMRGE